MKFRYYLLIVLVFMIPTILGYMTHTDKHFSGLMQPTDGDNYLSIMLQAKDGHLLFTNMYTNEDVPYLDVRPTYLVGGWLALMGIPAILAYHLLRIAGIVMLVFFLEKLIGLYFKNRVQRMYTMLFALIGSGIGYLFVIASWLGIKHYGSVDQWIPEANNFTVMLSHPHTIFAIALMTAGVYYFLKWNNNLEMKSLLYSALCMFIVGWIHLFVVITINLAIILFVLHRFIAKRKIDWRIVKHLLLYGLITIIPFIHTYYIFYFVPVYAAWNAQNVLETPPFHQVVFGYGLMFLAFVVLLAHMGKLKDKSRFLVYWLISVMILIYSPFNIQRRFLEGAHVAFAIALGLVMFSVVKKKYIHYAAIGALLLMVPMNAMHYYDQLHGLDNKFSYPYSVTRYITHDEFDAIKWLENTPKDSVIVAPYNLGNHIPGIVNRKVYIGHWAQTIDMDTKKQELDNYYSGTGQIPDINEPFYVILPSNPDSGLTKGLKLAYKNPQLEIYSR